MKPIAASSLFLCLIVSACTSGGGGNSQPGGPDVVIKAEDCLDPFFAVDDIQEEMGKHIRFGDAACVKKAITLGARAGEMVDKDFSSFGTEMVWPIHFALEDSPLFFANSKSKGIGVLKVLLEAGADANVKTPQGLTALQLSLGSELLKKYPAVADYLIRSKKTDLEVIDRRGDTPLLAMLREGQKAQVQALIQAGASVNAMSVRGESALQLAIQARFEDISIILLQRGLDPLRKDGDSNTSLHLAAIFRMENLVRAIIGKAVALDGRNNQRETALLLAVRANATKIARDLVTAGADVNAASNREAPLHAAVRNSNDELISLLVARVFDVNAVDSDRNTALILAIKSASAAQVRALLARGANADIAGSDKFTPLMLALDSRQAEKVADLVARSTVNMKGPDGRTAIFFATSSADARLLMNHRADINAVSDSGQTPLSNSVMANNTDLSLLYLASGADRQWRGSDKATLLHAAVARDNLAVVRALLDDKLDPEAVNFEGETPVFGIRSVAVLDLLVQRGAQINHHALDGRTVLLDLINGYLTIGRGDVDAVIARVVDLGADLNVSTKNSASLLHLVVASTPLLRTSEPFSYTWLLSLLLDHQADPNAINARRETPLHLVDTEVETRLLLKAGGKSGLKNIDQKTPVDLQRDKETALAVQIERLGKKIDGLEKNLREVPDNGAEAEALRSQIARLKAERDERLKRFQLVEKIIALLE